MSFSLIVLIRKQVMALSHYRTARLFFHSDFCGRGTSRSPLFGRLESRRATISRLAKRKIFHQGNVVTQ